MTYHLFLDESGDHGLSTIDQSFPVFVLCGIIISHDEYFKMGSRILELKETIWPGKKVILHSTDIRKQRKEFSILANPDVKDYFFTEINDILESFDYKIISAGVNKINYAKRYGLTGEDVYHLSLSYIMERAIFFTDDISGTKFINVMAEKRGKKEDGLLSQHYQKIHARGTYYVTSKRIQERFKRFVFHSKLDNLIGLQIADLIAYPIARYIMDKERANPAFEVVTKKFYQKNGILYGLKEFP